MTIAIKVENLGKKYILSHQNSEKYLSFRDVITNSTKKIFKPNQLKSNQEEFWALQNLNFDIKQGDRLGIIGRNGAGKSTLLKILSRITEPTTGQVKIKGRVASLLEVGTGFHPELTGRENIYLNGAILGMSKWEIKKKFDEIVAFAEVEKFLDTPVKRYSSGMYVRLAFAVAAHLEPEILIVDEVLAVGDAQFQKKCLGRMEEVGKEGRTVLFVSHNMSVIQSLCSKIIYLKNGTLDYHSENIIEGIKKYNYTENISSTSWQPETKVNFKNYLWLNSIRLVSRDGKTSERQISRVNDELYVEIDFDLNNLDSGLTIGYVLFNENEQPMYWSYQTDKVVTKLKVGRNVIKSKIPIEFLNIGDYRIGFLASIHFKEWISPPENNRISLGFEIIDLNGSEYFRFQRPTIISPILDWDIK
jgi:lipopolysaccharide transport system ATP-binding protein